MPKVLCTLENASEEISGVKFAAHERGMISEEISEEAAARFASIDGYELVEESESKPPAPAPAPAPAPKPAAAAKTSTKKAAPAPALVEQPAADAPAAEAPAADVPAADAPAADGKSEDPDAVF